MPKKSDHSDSASHRKWPWIVLGVVVLIIVILRLALMTGPVHRLARKIIINKAEAQLKPSLLIGHVSGDLWHEATLTNIKLKNDSTVASIDTLHIEYHPLSYFSDTFEIAEITIINPYVKVRQQPDSTFNVQHWMAATDTTDTTSSTFAVSISQLNIKKGRVDVSARTLQADSSFQIRKFNLAGGVDYSGEHYAVNLSKLNFAVTGTRISPITLRSREKLNEQSVSLQKLAIATAHSVFNASGNVNLTDSSGSLQAKAHPLGWQDVAAYADSLPVRRDMQLGLQINGDGHQIKMDLTANATGINDLDLSISIQQDSSLQLTAGQISAQTLDLATFLSDTTMPKLQKLQINAHGEVPISNYQKGHLKGTISAANIRQGAYGVDLLHGTFSLTPQQAKLELKPQKEGEQLNVNARVSEPWADVPEIDLHFSGRNINPAVWYPTGDKSMNGDLTFTGGVHGKGWVPGPSFWHYHLDVQQSSLMGQSIDHAAFSGRFNDQNLTNESKLTLKDSRLKLQAVVHQLQAIPRFSFSLKSQKLNLSRINGYEQYPSSINAVITGEGEGSALENLRLQASLRVDSSIFRGEKINDLSAQAQVADSVLTLRNGTLKSTIADGSFSAHLNLFDYYKPANRADFEIHLKDISSFASLANADILQATGMLKADLQPTGQDSLSVHSMLNLKDVNYNGQFTAPKIAGTAGLSVEKARHFSVDVHITKPTISSMSLENLSLQTKGQQKDSTTTGSYQIVLKGRKKGEVRQSGRYRMTSDSVKAKIDHFKVASAQDSLLLRRPFHVGYANGKVQTDTLRLYSKAQNTTLELAVPSADSVRQKVYWKTQNLDLAQMQKIFLEDPYFKGILNGHASVNRTDTSLTADAALSLRSLEYDGITIDTVQVGGQIKNERLNGQLSVRRGGEQIITGQADIPFAPQKKNHLDSAFLKQKVDARLQVKPIALGKFSDVLKKLGIKNTRGNFRFDGRLGGRTGHPKMEADLQLTDALLSGVPVDSLTAALRYRHDQSRLNFHSGLVSEGKKMIQIDAAMPFKLDLSNLDITLPAAKDSVSVDIAANDYKLKTLNDFLNHKQFRNIQGLVNADIHIRGQRDNLQPKGSITLNDVALRIVQAGIRVDHIHSTVQIQDKNIVVQNFNARSGKGKFSMQGKIGFQDLVPGALNLQASAKNFKIANTDKYNGIINLDMNMNGTATKPKLSGNLDVISGFVELSNFGQKSVENVQLDSTKSAGPNISLYDSLNLDLKLNLNPRFVIRNKRYLKMEIKLDGQVHLLKKPANDLQLFGTLNTVGGYAEPLGKRFDLQKGSIAFDGAPGNPQLNIHTRYEPPQTNQEIKIYYVIEGTVEKPEFKYSSDPPMDLSGIISYTLFGQPYYKLNSTEQGVANSSSTDLAADFAMEVIMNRLESLATGKLGIDVVKIDNTRVAGKSGTSITTGWYINPKVFFAIQNVITGSTPTTGFYLEYYLRKNLKLILSQGNNNQQGVDLQWDYDY